MKEAEINAIAVLVACYNRKQKTIAFLESLSAQSFFQENSVDIYLLDDGSTDGTSSAVKEQFPFVNILTESGGLYWVIAMIKVWEHAMSIKSYDLFCLVNDDVLFFKDSFERLMKNFKQQQSNNGTILVGSTQDPTTKILSYGGYTLNNIKYSKYSSVIPDKHVSLPCHLGNANFMLVDAITVKKIGIFFPYIHKFADFDYTFTACKAGVNVLVAPGYYGYCEYDHGNNWLSGDRPLKERINYLYSVKGLSYKDQLIYIKRNFPAGLVTSVIKLWMKTFFPIFWDKFKRRDSN